MASVGLNTAMMSATHQAAHTALSQSGKSATQRLGESLASTPATQDAAQVREAFTQFVGETFFSQMIKAMRTSTGKPAYFHGGQAEEVFRGQLDQTLAEEMTTASADKVAGPMFEHQFPQLARLLAEQPTTKTAPGLSVLNQLKRR